MPRNTKKSYLKFYKHELERAKQFREQEGYDQLWQRMIDMYRGRCAPVMNSPEDQVVVNVAFGTINVVYPSVSVNYPKITVTPNKPMDEDRAVIVEAITNYNWKHHNFQDHFRRAVKDYLIIGHGWLKTGYRYKEAYEPMGQDEKDAEFGELKQQADTYAAENPEMAGYLPSDEEINENLPETVLCIKEDRPFVERVSPFDIFVDPEATCMDDVRWICQRLYRPLEDVRRDQRYKKSVRDKIEADSGVDRNVDFQRSWFKRQSHEAENQRCTIYEWYDVHANTMSVCAEGSDDFLIDPHPIPFSFGHPFVMLRNYDVPDFFYPMGDLEAIEPLVQELNKTRSVTMKVREKFVPKTLFRARAFDAIGREALEGRQFNRWVPVAEENTPMADLVAPIPQVPTPPELFSHSEIVEKDIGDVSGISEYQRGQVPETRRTATEAAIISDSVNARAADKLAQIEGGIAQVARHVVALLQEFTTQVQVANVVGPDGAIFWVPYDAEDVKGEYDFSVEAGSTQPMNETVRRQTATAMMQTMAPFIDMGVVNPTELAQHVLKFGFGIKNPQQFLVDPMQAMMQQQMMGMGGEVPGQPGMQEPPMGGGYTNEETGEQGGIPPELMAQLGQQMGI